jgi:hypothetical protein
VYPDTRVHALNLGNYMAGWSGPPAVKYLAMLEDDWLASGDLAPVADNGWSLDDALMHHLGFPPYSDAIPFAHLHYPVIGAQERLMPPLSSRPDSTTLPDQFQLWTNQFEGRRYCWSVLYRFSNQRGPRGSSQAWKECVADPASPRCAELESEFASSVVSEARMTVYYVTLKRPVGARYARQAGFDGLTGWTSPPAQPRARGSKDDVLLPVPWRIAARLTSLDVSANAPTSNLRCDGPTGVPSEITVNDPVLAQMLQVGVHLIDDRTGQIFRITQRRSTGAPNAPILVLNGEYSMEDLYGDYYKDSSGSCKPRRPVPKQVTSPASDGELQYNWQNEWLCSVGDVGCTSGTRCCDEVDIQDPADVRFYWVFPPPVEMDRNAGIPVFTGSPPVVSIESRQVILN